MFAYHDIFLSENGPPTATTKHYKILILNIFIHSVSENKHGQHSDIDAALRYNEQQRSYVISQGYT